MDRREFLIAGIGAGAIGADIPGKRLLRDAVRKSTEFASEMAETRGELKPMALGLIIRPGENPEEEIAKVSQLGLTNCFLSLDEYIGKFSAEAAQKFRDALAKYELTATCAEVVGPGRLVWDFLDGPSTIGVVPRETRAARMDALKQTSDFAKLLGIPRVQTHCGFIPENPRDPLYGEAVEAIRKVAMHCGGNGQDFLMETGQETPTTMARAIQDVNMPNLGVGLDTANLILYGKANPVDALDIIGPRVKSIHAKDGKWPTDPMKLGEEVLIGTGRVDFARVFAMLHDLGYTGAVTIEREISGPQQMEDVRKEKAYLERIIKKVRGQSA
jgi:L-ribulose-5-phosphate 3-epimerase